MFDTCRNEFSGHSPSRKTSIACLPDEVLLEIFKYLNPHDLIFNVALVSHRWNILALDPAVWHNQVFKDDDHHDLRALHILSSAPTLREVSIAKFTNPDDVYAALITGHKDIKNLSVNFQQTCFNTTQLCDLLQRFPNLEKLDVQIPASTLDHHIYAVLKTLLKLSSLRLSGVVSDSEQLVEALRQCGSLQLLDLSSCRIVLRDTQFQSLLTSGNVWETLHLVTHFITDQGYGALALCKTLRDLALIKCRNLSEDCLEELAALTELRALAIKENCVLGATALVNFFNKETVVHLVKVDLTVYRADDEVALTVATNCVALMHLRLAMCLLTDKGVRDIVLNASHLTHLDLEFNNIRGDALRLIPKFLPNLAYLNLHLCYNVHINLLQLAQTLPNFTIVDPTGFPISTSAHGIQSSQNVYT